MTAHQHRPPTPEDVVLAAITAPLPCGGCGKVAGCWCILDVRHQDQTKRRVDVIVAALREYGHLAAPQGAPQPVTLAEVHETARWLAAEARHPRYAAEGWHRVMQSVADVDVAFAQAARDATNTQLEALNAARRVITLWLTEHGPEQPHG